MSLDPANIEGIAKELQLLGQEARRALKETCTNQADLEESYRQYLGKKGSLTQILKSLKDIGPDDRRKLGQLANEIRQSLESIYNSTLEALQKSAIEVRLQKENYDSLRPLSLQRGALHPITQMQYKVEDIFTSMGFQIMDGPEIESDEYNFTRLNFSADHPARDMQDTIWITNGKLMRTHTSAVQVRALQNLNPPFRMIAPGRCFRYEETDASHENTFHQVEGMMLGSNISVSHLIYIMKNFLASVFEQELQVRLRPGYFPFVEPGFELDMSCLLCESKGCQTCKQSTWIELLPCGLIHPNVLEAGGVDSKKWSGFAFGLGLDRLVMMRYGVEDIRHFLSGNLRFLKQF